MEELTAELKRELAGTYGSAVAVEYVDVYSPEMPRHPAVLRLLMQGNTPLPVICLNGEPVLAGGVSTEMIEEELHKLGV